MVLGSIVAVSIGITCPSVPRRSGPAGRDERSRVFPLFVESLQHSRPFLCHAYVRKTGSHFSGSTLEVVTRENRCDPFNSPLCLFARYHERRGDADDVLMGVRCQEAARCKRLAVAASASGLAV